MTNIQICLADAAGWTGSVLSQGIFESPDMELVAAMSQSYAGQVLGKALDIKVLTTPILTTATETLKTKRDVLMSSLYLTLIKFAFYIYCAGEHLHRLLESIYRKTLVLYSRLLIVHFFGNVCRYM